MDSKPSEESAQSAPFLDNGAHPQRSPHQKGRQKDETVDNVELECEKERTAVSVICKGITIAFTVAIAGASAISFSESHASTSLVFLLAMCIDVFSASVVIWRFCPRDEELGKKREETGQICLGFIEEMMALVGIAWCTYGLAMRDDSHLHETAEHRLHAKIIFGVAAGGFAFLTAAKVWLGIHFKSLTLIADAIDSGIGGAMALAVVISTLVSEKNVEALWYFDHVMGLCMALAIGIFATWLLYQRRETLKKEMHCDCCWREGDIKLKSDSLKR